VSVLAGNGNGTFAAALNFGTGTGPRFIVVADFSRDGKPDLAVVNYSSNNVSILHNTTPFDSAGTFAAAVNITAGTTPRAAAVGDFDRDGDLDLVVANEGSNNVSVRLNNGDGTFAAAVNNGVGTDPRAIVVDDFNRDGILDLVVANYGSNNLSALRGNGNGTFLTAVNYGTYGMPWSLAVGDFNRDGNPDLVVAIGVQVIETRLGNGDGTFAYPEFVGDLGSTVYYCSVTVGDFDRDGKLDIVRLPCSGSLVEVLWGNGDGTFADFTAHYGVNGLAHSAVGDFNRDGILDFAITNTPDNRIAILEGDGSRGTLVFSTTYGVGTRPRFISAGDFNRDGNSDLAVANGGSSNVSVLRGNGSGGFAAATHYSTAANPYTLAVGDLDRDGTLDLVAPNGTNVSIFFNRANGHKLFLPMILR